MTNLTVPVSILATSHSPAWAVPPLPTEIYFMPPRILLGRTRGRAFDAPFGLPLTHPRVMSLVSQRVPQVKNLDAAKQLYLNSQEEGVERSTALRVSLPFSYLSGLFWSGAEVREFHASWMSLQLKLHQVAQLS